MTDGTLHLHGVLEQIRDSLHLVGLPAEARRASMLANSLTSDRPLKIVVVGEFNSGKSTLVNALCGLNLLPAGIIPTTATINIVQHAPSLNVVSVHHDGSMTELAFAAETLQQFTARKGEHREIREIRIGVPGLPPDLILLDTPGVNDINETRSTIVYEMLPEADVIIFLLDVQQSMKRSEVDFLRDRIVRTSMVKTIFVLNHIDRVSDPIEIQKAVDYVRTSMISIYKEVAASFSQAGLEQLARELGRYSDDVPVFTVSAKQMLRSLEAGRDIEGDPQGLRSAIFALAPPELRLRSVWSGVTSQAYALLTRLRTEVDVQDSMRRMEHERVVADAHRNGEILGKTLEATRKTLNHVALQRTILRSDAESEVKAIYLEASSSLSARIQSSDKEQGLQSVQQEIGRKLELRMEGLNERIRRLATDCTQQASAFIPVRVSNPKLRPEHNEATSASHDWLAHILKDPVYGTGVVMLAPLAAFMFGWVGFAVVALPFVARMFGTESNGTTVEQIKKQLVRSEDEVKATICTSIEERLDAISMAIVDVLEEPQQRIRAACVLLSGQDGPQEAVLQSLLARTVEFESELVSLATMFGTHSPHLLADRLSAHRGISLASFQTTISHP